MKRLLWCAAALLVLPLAVAQADDWRLLGERLVNFSTDHDVIVVTGAEGTFTNIKLVVKRSAIEFLDLKVVFGNGETYDVPVRAVIPAGGETRVIDLPGAARVIRQVEFVYRSVGGSGRRALVRLWGKH